MRYVSETGLNVGTLSDENIDSLNYIPSAVMMLELDDVGELVYIAFNHEACWVTNMSAKDVLGKTTKAVFPGQQGTLASKWQHEAMNNGTQATYILTLLNEGNKYYVRTIVHPIMDPKGKFVRLIEVSEKVSETGHSIVIDGDGTTLIH